ncbi:MAG: hypothetical protein AB7L94_09930 [Kofleriaceae bacterium]
MVVASLLILALALAVLLMARDEPRRAVATPVPAPVPYVDAFTSSDENEVLAAIDQTAQRGQRLPALLLYHPSPIVVKRTLATMSGRDVTPYLLARKLRITQGESARW